MNFLLKLSGKVKDYLIVEQNFISEDTSSSHYILFGPMKTIRRVWNESYL